MFKRFLKNQKGLTLIELLAVVVILGIISAIAIPSIGGLIDNSKKDAHVANAQQMINAAKIAVTSDKGIVPGKGKSIYLNLAYLEERYLETVKDPDGGTYTKATANTPSAVDTSSFTEPSNDSYVVISADNNNKLSYKVKLVNSSRGVQTGGQGNAAGKAVAETDLSRENVR